MTGKTPRSNFNCHVYTQYIFWGTTALLQSIVKYKPMISQRSTAVYKLPLASCTVFGDQPHHSLRRGRLLSVRSRPIRTASWLLRITNYWQLSECRDTSKVYGRLAQTEIDPYLLLNTYGPYQVDFLGDELMISKPWSQLAYHFRWLTCQRLPLTCLIR